MGHPAPRRGGGHRPAAGGRRGGHRRHQPAGDDHPLGQGHRSAGVQRHRVAVPPHGGAVRGAEAPGAGGAHPLGHGSADRRLFLRQQDPLDTGQRARRPPPGGAGRGAVRHGGELADLEAHRPPCDRLRQRQPHHAVRHPPTLLGRGAVRHTGRAHGHAACAGAQQHGVRHGTAGHTGSGIAGGDAGVRRGGRPAVRPVRADLLRPRRSQEHLRHRLLHPDERGR